MLKKKQNNNNNNKNNNKIIRKIPWEKGGKETFEKAIWNAKKGKKFMDGTKMEGRHVRKKIN